MKQSGHLIPNEETGTGCPSLQSMEGHLQMSMEVWVDNNYNMDGWMDGRVGGCLAGWVNGWLSGWVDGWMD